MALTPKMGQLRTGQKVIIKPALEKEFPQIASDEDIPPGTHGKIDSIRIVSGIQICYVTFMGGFIKKLPGDFLAVVVPDKNLG